ncbi:sigma-70 family RNA polymerase sigma factor [Puniceicoccales bacterium CK1056]|uniref:RNA polymerase sigma factor n=1 Tax=Oceanipulchritudo coccoides TaxID=2706888 RepID=A0A6B2M6Z2_9BACT|nr:sigma-70 family RNA polymerase sigma factor [Oceanipulchritudo coccoides]NDV63410.1 sigma-70 family RNA polymerase sigma factor [Oceanipulchritudo coccoides]
MNEKTRNSMAVVQEQSDAELVAGCLEGDRESFARIVERYQRLLCSLAFSATGDLSKSEDIAQDAFVTAWQQLGKLREPEKLRSWLSGIVRNRIRRTWRSAERDPVALSEGEETIPNLASGENCAAGEAMEKEEQQLLWKALQSVPERYREPLVLYYREEHSVKAVAASLDLTESAVKQRLTRGRALLKQKLLQFVEGALERSTPGPVFTAGVIAAIATLSPPAKAAVTIGLGAAATHVSATAKTASLAGLLAMFSGAISAVFSVRAGLDQSRTQNERRATVWTAALLFGSFVVLILAVLGLRFAAARWTEHSVGLAVLSQVVVLGFALSWPLLLKSLLTHARNLRGRERRENPEAFADPRDSVDSKAGTYRSHFELLGIPFVHIRFAGPEPGSKPVVGWIAGGDRAIGILFAWGAFSCGLVSVGAVSVGVFTLGAVGVGLLSLGSVAFGYLSVGAMAIGQHAIGSLSAMGWKSALGGGFVLARDFAMGPIALAEHANDAVAEAFFANPHGDTLMLIFFVTVTLMTLVPVYLYAKGVRTRLGPKK